MIIRGYADKQGSYENNQILSKIRASWLGRKLDSSLTSLIKSIETKGCGDQYSTDSPKDNQDFRVAVIEVIANKI